MCGRYTTMTVDQRSIENRFGAKFISGHFEHYEPTYNAVPSQMLPIIRTHHENTIELAKWGFVSEGW
jgi:putative SOS response-associated peptidase YedK